MSPITEYEIIETINSLPNNKAPGPSKITYFFIKQTQKSVNKFARVGTIAATEKRAVYI